MSKVTEAELRARAGDDKGANAIVDLWVQTERDVHRAFRHVTWADEEIAAAMKRHPGAADLLWHARWDVLRPADGCAFPDQEFVWRGHFRQQLDRVATGGDTREATWAEICMICSAASMKAPLRSAAVGLYMKAWANAFPGAPGFGGDEDFAKEVAHYERMEGYEMREFERETLRAVARRNPGRRMPAAEITCDGEHWGETVPCRFIPGTLDGSPDPAGNGHRKPRRAPRPAPAKASPQPDEDGEMTLF